MEGHESTVPERVWDISSHGETSWRGWSEEGTRHKMEASHLLIHGDESARGEEKRHCRIWLEPLEKTRESTVPESGTSTQERTRAGTTRTCAPFPGSRHAVQEAGAGRHARRECGGGEGDGGGGEGCRGLEGGEHRCAAMQAASYVRCAEAWRGLGPAAAPGTWAHFEGWRAVLRATLAFTRCSRS